MSYTEKFSVPTYYPNFKCKCENCSLTCCSGWIVTLSRDEYYRLTSLNASDKLREKLDRALYILDHATIEKYAAIGFNYLGECHLLDDCGLCSLQCEYGEAPMTYACRYFPRSPKRTPMQKFECSCSCSCEAVIDALIADTAPFNTIDMELTFESAHPPIRIIPSHLQKFAPYYDDIRQASLGFLAQRDLSITARLREIGAFLIEISSVPIAELQSAVENRSLSKIPTKFSFPVFIDAVTHLTDRLSEKSIYIAECGEAFNAMRSEFKDVDIGDFETAYTRAEEELSFRFPDYYLLLEKVLSNHIFYSGFPFTDEHELIEHSFASLISLYAMLSAYSVSVAWMNPELEESELKSRIINMYAKAFRQFEGSNFDIKSVLLLRQIGFDKDKNIFELL